MAMLYCLGVLALIVILLFVLVPSKKEGYGGGGHGGGSYGGHGGGSYGGGSQAGVSYGGTRGSIGRHSGDRGNRGHGGANYGNHYGKYGGTNGFYPGWWDTYFDGYPWSWWWINDRARAVGYVDDYPGWCEFCKYIPYYDQPQACFAQC